jgi:two-component system, LytTR family, response regulator
MNPEITAIIIEDIKAFHQTIEMFVAEVAPDVRILGNATSLVEAEILIRQFRPMLLFLDIQFESEGKTAFDLLSRFANQEGFNFQVIIITAHNEQKYYAEAFNFGALHFLTKPLDKYKLKEAIHRVSASIPVFRLNQWMDQILAVRDQQNSVKIPDRIVVEGMSFNEVVQIKDIVFMEASGRYTYIYLNSVGIQPLCSSYNLGEYERRIMGNPKFFRIHRNKIINLDYLVRYSKKERSIYLISPFDKQLASKERFIELMNHIEIINLV